MWKLNIHLKKTKKNVQVIVVCNFRVISLERRASLLLGLQCTSEGANTHGGTQHNHSMIQSSQVNQKVFRHENAPCNIQDEIPAYLFPYYSTYPKHRGPLDGKTKIPAITKKQSAQPLDGGHHNVFCREIQTNNISTANPKRWLCQEGSVSLWKADG